MYATAFTIAVRRPSAVTRSAHPAFEVGVAHLEVITVSEARAGALIGA
jgi:hypothetical protein